MTPISLADVVFATGGRLDGGARPEDQVTGVVIDSRSARAGALFAALQGEHVDGHDYATGAFAVGAVAVLAARPLGVPAVVVDDVVVALGRLATLVCARSSAVVVGVTGSTGKTSTKDLLAAVLATTGEVVAPVSSYNNEIGLPLTVLRVTESTRWLVLEMSARRTGHIADLCAIAPPRIGVVLNVGSAHLGEFGSRSAIARAKGELVEALPSDGVAILNADDDLVRRMGSLTDARIVTFGRAEDADVRATDVDVDETGRASFTLVRADGRARVRLAVVGEHAVSNALAAAAVAAEAGLSAAATAAALAAAQPASRWRMEVRETGDGVTVVNDAYNANPESMAAALRALRVLAHPADGPPRRAWAVFGEMAELGAESDAAHDQLGRLAAETGVDRLVCVGDGARRIGVAARAAGLAAVSDVADAGTAAALLGTELRPGDVVLVKASRVVGLERVALALTPDPPPQQTMGGAA